MNEKKLAIAETLRIALWKENVSLEIYKSAMISENKDKNQDGCEMPHNCSANIGFTILKPT